MITYLKSSNPLGDEEIENLVLDSLLSKSPSLVSILCHAVIPDIFSSMKEGNYRSYARGGLLHIAKREERDIQIFEQLITDTMEGYAMELYQTTKRKKKTMDYWFRYLHEDAVLSASQFRKSLVISIGYRPLEPGISDKQTIHKTIRNRMPALLALAKVLEF